MIASRRLLAAAAGLLLAPVLVACGTDGTGVKGYVTGTGSISQVSPSDRKPIGTIEGETLDGKQLRLASYAAGRPAVVNTWGSWCAPCRKEAPVLVAAQRRLGEDVAFLGINIRDSGAQDQAKAFERRFEVPYPSLYDPTGRSLLRTPGRTASVSIPSTLVIDSKGRLAATVVGAVPTARTLAELVQDAG
ncbi:hypothetical protein GCM10011519_18850 [Marmoricola endophyticus]|uniref:Thioredoxin domain-containing protein n=1 Tax=Marmoricola endophyticus TaxID=2040280 RepID=A0A917F213_9ACTN|nr:TlpA disulfide reductase family protein [Marmoricola endophyticus]GGF45224.1 hypothetical protein GCM10011519_18850 [Marmoricola endophyticus]